MKINPLVLLTLCVAAVRTDSADVATLIDNCAQHYEKINTFQAHVQ